MTLTAPSSLSITNTTTSTQTIGWTNNDAYTRIYIYKSLNGTDYTQDGYVNYPGAVYGKTGLNDNTRYYWKARGWTSADGYSDYSNVDNDWTKPDAPTNLRHTTITPSSIRVYWDNSAYTYTQVYVDGVLNATEDPGDITHNITGLAEETTYSIKVRHYNTSSGYYSAFTAAEDYTTGVAASEDGSETVTLSDSGSGSAGYGESGSDTVTVTSSGSVIGDYIGSGSDTVTVLDGGADVALTPLQLDFQYLFGSFDGKVYAESEDYKADYQTAITSSYRTNQTDFADQHVDLMGRWHTLYKVRIWYTDLSANTPMECRVSTDGGSTWTTKSKSVGTGSLTDKSVDFYFVLTGHHFIFNVRSESDDCGFQLVSIVPMFLPRGESFSI